MQLKSSKEEQQFKEDTKVIIQEFKEYPIRTENKIFKIQKNQELNELKSQEKDDLIVITAIDFDLSQGSTTKSQEIMKINFTKNTIFIQAKLLEDLSTQLMDINSVTEQNPKKAGEEGKAEILTIIQKQPRIKIF